MSKSKRAAPGAAIDIGISEKDRGASAGAGPAR